MRRKVQGDRRLKIVDCTGPRKKSAICSADWRGWNLRRAGAVLGTVGVALAASVALPASLQGLAWGLREVLENVSR